MSRRWVERSAVALANTSALFLVLEVIGAIVVAVGVSIVADAIAVPTCRWCSQNAFDETMRRLVIADDRLAAATLSHQLSIIFLPLLTVVGTAVPALFTDRRRGALQNFVLILAAFILTTGITSPIKALTSRERPGFVHGMATEAASYPTERFASFFSGDTAWAFCFAAAGAAIAHLRGYRVARPIAIVGGLAAAATALLRMRADMHWATDVLTGATVGTLIGGGLPFLLHPRAARSESTAVVLPIPQPAAAPVAEDSRAA
jgi:membrane-associated phospholipid phosphatase